MDKGKVLVLVLVLVLTWFCGAGAVPVELVLLPWFGFVGEWVVRGFLCGCTGTGRHDEEGGKRRRFLK